MGQRPFEPEAVKDVSLPQGRAAALKENLCRKTSVIGPEAVELEAVKAVSLPQMRAVTLKKNL